VKQKISPRPQSGKRSPACSPHVIYRVNNWASYNRALMRRGDLTVWFSEEVLSGWHYQGPPQRGAQFHYADLAIATALTLRQVFALPLRQTQGFLTSILRLMGVVLDVPDYTTLCRRQASLALDLGVRPTAEPRHLVVDSTGVKVYGEGEWKVRQYGWSYRRTWRKLHLGVDAQTGEIVAQTLTPAATDDGSQLRPLLAQIPVSISRCYGDGAYDQWTVLRQLAYPATGQTAPIEAVIPPRRGAQPRRAKRRYRHIEARNQRVRMIARRGRKRWKRDSGYHQRSLGESAISRYKRIFGPRLRARQGDRQQVEVRLGCRILNQMTHLGRPDSYQVEVMK
jgi:hypothetical protein